MTLHALKQRFITELADVLSENERKSVFHWLVEAYLDLSPVAIVMQGDESVPAAALFKFEAALERLKAAEPVQYILGHTEFFGLRFAVNANTLIPRPETEELVQLIRDQNQKIKDPLRVLDIGTGSGCIAVSLAKELPQAEVSAVDVSEETLKTAKLNADANQVKVGFFQADILTLKQLPGAYEVIVSNPPYVRHSEKQKMEANVLDFEPHLALFVEDDNPLIFYDKIADLAQKHLTENGSLYFEINEFLGQELVTLIEEKGFEDVQLIKDIYGKNRMLHAVLKKRAIPVD